MFCLLVRNNPDVWAKTSGLLQVSPDIDRISATIPKNSTKRRDYCITRHRSILSRLI